MAGHRQRLDLAERQRRRALDVVLLVEGAQLALRRRRARPVRRAAVVSAHAERRAGEREAPEQVVPVGVRGEQPADREAGLLEHGRAGPRARRGDRRVDDEALVAAAQRPCTSSARRGDVTTRTSGCSAATRMRAQRARAPSSLAASRRFLTSAVGFFCPGSSVSLLRLTQITGTLSFSARLDVVVVAGRDVDPALLGAHPPRALLEVRRVGLVGAHLLGGDDEVEVVRDVAPRLAEQLVVDVRDQAGLELLGELLELRVGLLERRPALRRESGRKPERDGSSGQSMSLGDLDRRAAQDLGVELVGAALDLALDLVEAAG